MAKTKRPLAGLLLSPLFLSFVLVGLAAGTRMGTLSAQSGSVPVSLDPPSSSMTQGQVVTLNVIIDASSQPIDTVQVFLDFDPALLQVVDSAGNPAGTVEFGQVVGGELSQPLLNQVDNTAGRIGVAAGKGPAAGGADVNRRFTLALVRLKALANSAKTNIAIDVEEAQTPQRTKVYFQGSEVTGGITGSAVTFSAIPVPTATPAPPPVRAAGGGGGGLIAGGSTGGYRLPTPSASGAFTVPATLLPTPLPAVIEPSGPTVAPAEAPELHAPEPTVESQIASPLSAEAPPADELNATASAEDQEAGTSPGASGTPPADASGEGSVIVSVLLFLAIGLGLVGVVGAAALTNSRVKEVLLGKP